MRTVKLTTKLIFLSISLAGCLKERACTNFFGVSDHGMRKYKWSKSVFYSGTDSSYTLYAEAFTDQYEFEITEHITGKIRNDRILFYLRENNFEILRFRPICDDFQHLIDPNTGGFTDGYTYYYNVENEQFDLRAFGLDSLKIRFPFPEADNIYERLD